MTIEIKMPALSPTMEKGNLSKWLVAEGDKVAAGDVIAEIETDKATMEVESADDGRMGRQLVANGTEDIAVGTVIAHLLEEGESAEAAAKSAPSKSAPAEPAPVEPAASKPAPKPVEAAPKADKEAAKAAPPAPVKAAAAEVSPADDDDSIIASPLARRLARQKGIDLHGVTGSGPGGRIVKQDLEGVAAGGRATSTAVVPASPPADAPYEEVRLSAMRKIIAQRLTLSKQTVPHFYLTVDIEIDALLALRKDVNAQADQKVSVNDFIIRGLALALKKVPHANVQFAGDKLYRFSRSDISVAVATDGGLITPIIRDAEHKGLAAISTEMKALAEKARAGKLMPEEYQGGTISLSNLGMYGVKQFDAVINPPQAAILAVGAGEERAVVKEGQFAMATVMSATLSCDHRAIDGAVGAEFLAAFKNLMQSPLLMLL